MDRWDALEAQTPSTRGLCWMKQSLSVCVPGLCRTEIPFRSAWMALKLWAIRGVKTQFSGEESAVPGLLGPGLAEPRRAGL